MTWAAWGALTLGSLGAVVGAIIGLAAYPPTAVFAAIEVGVPSMVVGFVVGLVAGAIVAAFRRWRRRSSTP